MSILKKRATIYFDPDIHKVLKIKAATLNKSISELIDQTIRRELMEDEEDIRTFEERVSEPSIAYETVLKQLKTDGKL